MPMKTYVIHATCRYVVKCKADGRTESGQSRPTISVDAGSREAAIRTATRQMKASYASDYWPVVSFTLTPELVRVIEHPTAAQKRALTRFLPGGKGSRRRPLDRGMLQRLVDKGWLEGSIKEGYVLTPSGRVEASK